MMNFLGFTQDGDTYPDWPSDLDVQPVDAAWREAAVDSARVFGNEFFKVLIRFINLKRDRLMRILSFRKISSSILSLDHDCCW